VLCISADTTLQEAVDIMGDNDIDCLPVVTGLLLVGMVTRDALALAEKSTVAPPCAVCVPEAYALQDSQSNDANELFLCDRCERTVAANGRC
jgi:CBS-domain-containing membrane protein